MHDWVRMLPDLVAFYIAGGNVAHVVDSVAVSPMLFVFSSGTHQNIGIIELPLNTFQL